MADHEKLRILVADDDPVALLLMQRYLDATGHEILTATNGMEAMRVILDQGPQILITDWNMPEMDGLELCHSIRSNEGCGFVYVILVTANTEGDRIVEAYAAGIDDFLPKPFRQKDLVPRLHAAQRIIGLQSDLDRRNLELHRANAQMAVTAEELAHANEKLQELATTDELTSLINRREVLRRLADHWAQAIRHNEPLSCMMIDIDHFKNVNDALGHDAGDQVLVAVGKAVSESTREGEAVARLGGEEFLVLCPRATEQHAAMGAERLCGVVESLSIDCVGGPCEVTISLGVAERTDLMASPEDLLKAADKALYQAKRAGRNQVCLAGNAEPGPDPEGRMPQAPAEQLQARGERARVMALLLDLSRNLIAAKGLPAVLETTVTAAAELTCCREVSILLPSAAHDALTVALSVGVDPKVAGAVRIPLVSADGCDRLSYRDPIVIHTRAEFEEQRHLLGTDSLHTIPLVSTVLSVGEHEIGVLNIAGRYGDRPFSALELEYLGLLCNNAASMIQGQLHHEALDQARDSIVLAFAALAENRDGDTGRHLERVTRYCMLLAEELRTQPWHRDEITDEFMHSLRRAVPLHDIGKVATPDRILLKPGPLTPEEREIMRRHAAVGAATIRAVIERTAAVDFLEMAEQIAHFHHERYNGEGYPQGLRDESIPLAARLVAVADVYDALTTKRVYKEPISHKEAYRIIVEGSGSQFDPVVVAAFEKHHEEFTRLAEELTDGHGKDTLAPPAETAGYQLAGSA
jgi:diguanylate cyclase (GGDEF)-like protein